MTPRVVVVADDFTGGNALAANIAGEGARVVNVDLASVGEHGGEVAEGFDVVVVTANSRHDTPADSASKVRAALDWTGPAELFSNRIDTTLRGNVSASTAALLAEVRSRSARRVVCICVPAHPAAGRQTVGGIQLLRGVRLEDTELADDPLNPMSSSDVRAVVRAHVELDVDLIPLDVVTGTEGALTSRLRSAAAAADVVVVDALTEEHLERIALAAARLRQEITWTTADPGPFTAALARALGLLVPTSDGAGPILAVSGSATVLTRRQLQRLRESRHVHVVLATALATERGDEADRVLAAQTVEVMNAADAGDVVLIATCLDDTHLVYDPQVAARLPDRLAAIARHATDARHPSGLYATGGDVTAALLSALEAFGLAVDGEVVPLAVTASLVGGPWEGTRVVTKGGLVGDADTAIACIAALEAAPSAPPAQPTRALITSLHHQGET